MASSTYKSRLQNENTKWRLSPIIFERILEVFYCKPKIDLFASCINYQIDQYALWHPDRNAVAIYTFSISWEELSFYAIPFFNLIGAAIAKIRQEKCLEVITGSLEHGRKHSCGFPWRYPYWKISQYFLLQIYWLYNPKDQRNAHFIQKWNY